MDTLFALPERISPEPKVRAPELPVWSSNKARLVANYLFLFLQVTKHGNYIDGFAGPQNEDRRASWTARLVLELEPQWIRHFYLFDRDRGQVAALRELARMHGRRTVDVFEGDFNEKVKDILRPDVLRRREAAFALLDQRTFECEWSTVGQLAAYKDPTKIELFYFFAQGWLDRALAGARRDGMAAIERWWGRDDWQILRGMHATERAMLMSDRFKRELGYLSAKPWPIRERAGAGRVMYHMIHATDHPEAPHLMERAYVGAAQIHSGVTQLSIPGT